MNAAEATATPHEASAVLQRYRRVALGISLSSLLLPVFAMRAWLIALPLMLPINVVALLVARAGRRRVRRMTGADPGAGAADDVAKAGLAFGVAGLLFFALIVIVVGAAFALFVSVFESCLQDALR